MRGGSGITLLARLYEREMEDHCDGELPEMELPTERWPLRALRPLGWKSRVCHYTRLMEVAMSPVVITVKMLLQV
jgi:hypothetical protein